MEKNSCQARKWASKGSLAVALLGLAMVPGARAATPCQSCHPQQAEAFAHTPMGRSLNPAPQPAEARFRHARSGTLFQVQSERGRLVHRITRGSLTATYPVEFAIGSGIHGQGYVVAVGNLLFQSPISVYRNGTQWDVAPGYEQMPAPDFNRQVTSDCLLCHASGRTSITCERCHGDGTEHAQRPSRANIVNPSRLPAANRDSICEQCHLNGEARVLNPGMDFSDFRPGRTVEDALSVFVYDRSARDLKVVSHVEQLAQSTCQRATGKLWCGTCHQPHGQPVNVSERCQGCHATRSAGHPQSSETCQSCHMPKRQAWDGGHSAFTDHRIRKRPADLPEAVAPTKLRAWREPADPALRTRNLGLAYIIVGERDNSSEFVNRGYQLLVEAYRNNPRDADVLASLGMVLFVKNQVAGAVKVLSAAVAARPGDAKLHQKLGVVLREAGREREAIGQLETAITLDPSLESAYHLLAKWYTAPDLRRSALERYLKVNPQNIIAREAIAALPRP